MPAKLLSCSFLTLLLPWFSLSLSFPPSHSPFLFVSLTLTTPHPPPFLFFLPLHLSHSTSPCLPLHPLLFSSVVAARRELHCCARCLWVRGEEHGQAESSHPHPLANKAAFTKVPRPLAFRRATSFWGGSSLNCFYSQQTASDLTGSCFGTAELCPREIVLIKEEATALQPLEHGQRPWQWQPGVCAVLEDDLCNSSVFDKNNHKTQVAMY